MLSNNIELFVCAHTVIEFEGMDKDKNVILKRAFDILIWHIYISTHTYTSLCILYIKQIYPFYSCCLLLFSFTFTIFFLSNNSVHTYLK